MARGPRKKKDDLKPVGTGNLSHTTTSNELTDDQRQALFFQNMKKISALKKEVASLTSDLRDAFKVAKADGFPKKDFDFAFALENDKDDEAIDRRRREAEIALWVGHPIGTQGDLFDSDKSGDKRSQHERGHAAGKKDGLSGEPCKPVYDPGTDGYDGYMQGWHEGAAVKANMAGEQQEGDILLRRGGNEPATMDAFDAAAEKPWPDDVAVSNKDAEPV